MSDSNQQETPTSLRGKRNPVRLSLPLLVVILLLAGTITLLLVVLLRSPTRETQSTRLTNATSPPGATELAESTPADTSIAQPAAGVRRIAIAGFEGANASSGVDQLIEGSLLATIAAEGLADSIEVVRAQQIATSHDEAQDLLESQAADLLIWGHVDDASVRARIAFAAPQQSELQRVHGTPVSSVILFPQDMEFYISRSLGADMTFLSLITIGQINFADGQLEIAQQQLRSALLTMPATLPREARDRSIAIVNFHDGLIAQQANDSLASLQAYSQTLRLYDSFASAHNNRATIYYEAGDYQAAIVDFDVALTTIDSDADSHLAVVYANRGLAQLALDDLDAALDDAERLFELGDDTSGFNLRGLIYYRAGDYQAALQDFEAVTQLAPTSVGAQFNLAATLDALDRSADAIEVYTALLENHPQDALAFAYRGDAYLHLNLNNEAVTDYDEALKHDLSLVYAYQRRAIFYIARGNYDVALADLLAALAITVQNPLTYALLGDVYAAQYELVAAEDAYDIALDKQPDMVPALAGRGGVLRARRNFVSAQRDLELALESGGPTVTLQQDLGLVYYEFGRYDDAVAAFEYVIENATDPAPGYAALALAIDSQLQRAAAEDALREALELDQRLADIDYLRDQLLWSPNTLNRIVSILRRIEAADES